MTTLVLAAPTVQIGSASGGTPGPLVATPNALPAAETSIAANAGFSFPNNGAVILRVVTGTVVGTLTFLLQKTTEGQTPAGFVVSGSLVASTGYLWGPFSPSDFNDVNGLFQATWTGFTGGSVGVYVLPSNVFGK